MNPEQVANVVVDDLRSRGFRVENEPEYSASWDGYWLEVVDPDGLITSILVKSGN